MKSLNTVLQKFFKDSGLEEPMKRYRVFQDWPELVGERVARVTTPQRVTDGVLFVRVKNDTWRHELLFYKIEILRTIQEKLGSESIRDIVWF